MDEVPIVLVDPAVAKLDREARIRLAARSCLCGTARLPFVCARHDVGCDIGAVCDEVATIRGTKGA